MLRVRSYNWWHKIEVNEEITVTINEVPPDNPPKGLYKAERVMCNSIESGQNALHKDHVYTIKDVRYTYCPLDTVEDCIDSIIMEDKFARYGIKEDNMLVILEEWTKEHLTSYVTKAVTNNIPSNVPDFGKEDEKVKQHPDNC